MQPILVPVKATWFSMMAAKGVNALRPSRVVLFVFAATLLSIGLALSESGSFGSWVRVVFPGLIALRVVVMGLSAWADTGASKRLDGTLSFTPEGLTLTRADGSIVPHPWSWVLQVSEPKGAFVLRVDERGGRAIIFLRHESLRALGSFESLRALLVQAGKLQ